MGITDRVDEELYIRWVQFSVFTPLMESFSQPENPTSNLAYNYSGRADSIYRKFAHLRIKLFPYIYSYAHKVRLEGKQMMQAANNPYEYFYGDEMFVAPIYKQSETKRKITLPRGNWVNFWTNKIENGENTIEVEAPIDQIPLFIKQGSIIPMRQYASSIEKGTNDTLIIHVYTGANGHFTLIEDDGTSNDYLNGDYATTHFILTKGSKSDKLVIEPTVGTFNGMKLNREIKLVIHSNKRVRKIVFLRKNMLKSQFDHKMNTTFCALKKQNKNIFLITYE